MCRIESSSSSSNTTTQTMAEYLQENGQTLNSRLEFSIGIIWLCSYRCDCYVHVGPLDSVITVQYTQCPDDMHSFPRRCCQSASEPPRTRASNPHHPRARVEVQVGVAHQVVMWALLISCASIGTFYFCYECISVSNILIAQNTNQKSWASR